MPLSSIDLNSRDAAVETYRNYTVWIVISWRERWSLIMNPSAIGINTYESSAPALTSGAPATPRAWRLSPRSLFMFDASVGSWRMALAPDGTSDPEWC